MYNSVAERSNTNPRPNGQYSTGETGPHSKIPRPVRLAPMNADWYKPSAPAPAKPAPHGLSATALANPGPLGLSATALPTFVLSAVNAGLITGSATNIVLSLALFYGGLTQFCAGMWDFKVGNTFGATASASYGAFWLTAGFAFLPIFHDKSLVALAGPEGMGTFFLGWTIFTGIMFLGTFKLNLSLVAVFFFLFLTLLSLSIAQLLLSPGMQICAGWLGLATACLAWYTALAQILAATNSPFKLPVFPLS